VSQRAMRSHTGLRRAALGAVMPGDAAAFHRSPASNGPSRGRGCDRYAQVVNDHIIREREQECYEAQTIMGSDVS
jgi:hypothetical protein